MLTTFGEYIRKHRAEKGLTLTQLAAKIGMDSANLSKIENGRRSFDEKRLKSLSQALEIDIEKIKMEYFSDLFAHKLYDSNCSRETLVLAEKKVKYLAQKSAKQGKITF